MTIHYLNAQIAAGADVIMVFDTWGGILAHRDYLEFSLKYLSIIANAITREREGQRLPLIFFTKGGGPWLEQIAASGCDAVGLDATVRINQARKRIGDKVALQGNLEPYLLYASPEKIEQRVKNIIEDFNAPTGHVFNLGHGIDKDTPISHVEALVEAVHRYGKHDV